jgi:oligopeptide/dipeptide ABC transporter ATP-binding protein
VSGEGEPGPLLAVRDLTVAFPAGRGWAEVVRGAGFEVGHGEFVGLVGESGSGKSVTALAVLGLVPPPGTIRRGEIRFEGHDLLTSSEPELRKVRGGQIGMVFQEPAAALNPVLTIGVQIAEAVRLHRSLGRREARAEALALLELVAMPEPAARLGCYPHELSGGQRQRALLAVALAGRPRLLIADEPTTALDVTIQAQILELLERLRRELDLAVLLITHDLAVVAETCERVVVMYAGRVVEDAPIGPLFAHPAHPYTRGLLAAVPVLGRPAPRGELPTIPGQVPRPDDLPAGCVFHPRCADVMPHCREREPAVYRLGGDREVRCYLHADGGVGR